MQTSVAEIIDRGNSQFEISGVIDFYSVPGLMSTIRRELKDAPDVKISFSGVDACDSSSIALMLEIAKLMKGKEVSFDDIPQQVVALIDAYGVADELREIGADIK